MGLSLKKALSFSNWAKLCKPCVNYINQDSSDGRTLTDSAKETSWSFESWPLNPGPNIFIQFKTCISLTYVYLSYAQLNFFFIAPAPEIFTPSTEIPGVTFTGYGLNTAVTGKYFCIEYIY